MSKLIVTFAPMSGPDFLAKAELIASSLAGNAYFPEPWPAPLPPLAQLNTAVDAYQTAYYAAVGGDKNKISIRQAARSSVTSILKAFAPYLEVISQGNDVMLGTTGYDIRKPPVRSSAVIPEAPTGVQLVNGQLSGTLVVKAHAPSGAASYQAQTMDQGTTGGVWTDAGTFAHCSKIQLTGLTAGKTYSVRIRAIGTAGPGAWSQVATMMSM